MNSIPTTYFCATLPELRMMLAKDGLDTIVAVTACSKLSEIPQGLPKLVDVMQGKTSFVVARESGDIAFVNTAAWWKRRILSLRKQKSLLGPSLQHSQNAAMFMVPAVDESRRQISPGFVSNYPRESELYRLLKSKLSESTQIRNGFLVSTEISMLLDQGYTIVVG